VLPAQFDLGTSSAAILFAGFVQGIALVALVAATLHISGTFSLSISLSSFLTTDLCSYRLLAQAAI
jgi:hypothetical protein